LSFSIGEVAAMKPKTIITFVLLAFVVASVGFLVAKEAMKARGGAADPAATAPPAGPPVGHKVIAYYFHVSVRCPTCPRSRARWRRGPWRIST
jgi:hypothetical protein